MVFDANATVPMLFCIYIYYIYTYIFDDFCIPAFLGTSMPRQTICMGFVWVHAYSHRLSKVYTKKYHCIFQTWAHDLDRLLCLRGSASHLSDELDIDSTSGCRFFVAAVFLFEKMVPQERRGPKSYVWAWIYFGFLLKHLLDPFGTFVL